MAASAWQFYNSFRKKLGQGGIDLSGTNFRMALVKTASNYTDATLSAWTSVNNEVSEQFGYSSSGQALSAESWASTSAGQYTFDASDGYWSANGGSMTSIKGAVIFQSGGALVCHSQLTTTGEITITDGNSLTIQFHANGIFELT